MVIRRGAGDEDMALQPTNRDISESMLQWWMARNEGEGQQSSLGLN